MNRKRIIGRIGIEMFQHVIAFFILIAIAGLLLNSYIAVESINGVQSYKILSDNISQEFEESEVYYDLFQNAVSNITQLVVIKEQLESNGVFSPNQKIDITQYTTKIGKDKGCKTTAVYELDDLIKWGKYGVSYTMNSFSMTEFIEYFGECIFQENFMLDEYGQLCFAGFSKVEQEEKKYHVEAAQASAKEQQTDLTQKEILLQTDPLIQEMNSYTKEQLEDMVFSYIMGKNLSGIEISREDDGRLRVTVKLLKCRYSTANGEKRLTKCADNWVDYMKLQNNLTEAINSLTQNYQLYQIFNETYAQDRTNVKYMIRMMTDEGMQTYTNVGEIKEYWDEDVTEYFSEYRRYLIYYPDNLVFMGNMLLSEEELDNYIGMYEYAYPDTTRIWMGVDTNYSTAGDAFYKANAIYEKIVPNIGNIVVCILILVVLWIALAIMLTVTAGVAYQENGEKELFLTRFDHVWTELFLLSAAGCIGLDLFGARVLENVAATAGVLPVEILGIPLTKIYRYTVFGIYGVFISVTSSFMWYSLVRRVKFGNLWSDSLLRFLGIWVARMFRFIFRHKNSAISVLIPYNLFLFLNFSGLVLLLKKQESEWIQIFVFCGLVLLDVVVGGVIFKRNTERIEIVAGINKIRNGEVDFILDTDNLHGGNRELADAVNNIGEGIRKAVKTSMKDEQMKTDLITNVSHDIKTPLTSIINYVDLLKRLKIKEEPAKGYIEILDSKAHRLKQLTDDLVEASKISSGNIELNREKLNLTELLNQGIGEFSEKFEEKGLPVIFEQNNTPAFILADSRRMWRVIENLFNNICKYALEATRVYIDLEKENGFVYVSVKNISKQQMNIRPEELTERFIRGDSSRSTEGSGLGLSIAKSLVQVQGGTFDILLDGDLFKIKIGFPEYKEQPEEIAELEEK